MASTCVSHDALTGYTPSHDLTFLESQQRAPAIRGLLYKERQERPQRENAHIRWDEQCIAEHDKERGTRQKIDEPDTPFVRSPESSDGEEESCAPKALASSQPQELDADDERIATSPTSMAMLTNRLNQLVESSSQRRDSRSSGSDGEVSREVQASEACRPETKSVSSRIRLPEEDEGHPKASTSEFKARRAKHYNEFAAIKALRKKKGADSESSADSDTSDEAAAAAKKEWKARQARSLGGDVGNRTGGIDSVSGTHPTNLQETSECKASSLPSRTLPNPMEEGGRPPVHFGEEESLAGGARGGGGDEAWRSKRNAHYRDMAAAFRSVPPASDDSDSGGDSS